MHENDNCGNEFVGRSELDKYSEAVVKITENQLKWLVPFAEKYRVIQKPLKPASITVKQHSGDWAMIFLVQQGKPSEVTVTGYQPYKPGKTVKTRPQDELPSFILTMRFVLGMPQLYEFYGNPQKKEGIWEDVKVRILPVIIYMQQFQEHAITSTRKLTNSNKKKIFQTTYTLVPVCNEIPDSFLFLGKKLDVYKSKFQKDINKLMQYGLVVNVNALDFDWLTSVVNDVIKNETAEGNETPLYNAKLDERLIGVDGYDIAAIRVNLPEEDEDGRYMQIQIRKCDDGIFQLDYYEECSEECLLIEFINARTFQYELVYVEGNGVIVEDDSRHAKLIASIFREVLTYLRLSDLEFELKEDGSYRSVTIERFPNLFDNQAS